MTFSKLLLLTLVIAFVLIFALIGCGAGALKTVTSIGGIYTVKHPDGYPVVCFIEGGSSGGLFCMKDADLK